jgi:hypothetical protein
MYRCILTANLYEEKFFILSFAIYETKHTAHFLVKGDHPGEKADASIIGMKGPSRDIFCGRFRGLQSHPKKNLAQSSIKAVEPRSAHP